MKVKYLGESDALCLLNGKVYNVLSIEYGYYRIVDETGEDFLYDTDAFLIVESGAVKTIDDEGERTSDAGIALALLSDELLQFVEKETGFNKAAIAKMDDDAFSDLYDTIADIEINAELEEYSNPSERFDNASNFITIVGNALYRPTHICPVCGQYEFEERGSDDICEICGWQDDIVQELNPDEECGENQMSLNQAKEAWKNGEKVE